MLPADHLPYPLRTPGRCRMEEAGNARRRAERRARRAAARQAGQGAGLS